MTTRFVDVEEPFSCRKWRLFFSIAFIRSQIVAIRLGSSTSGLFMSPGYRSVFCTQHIDFQRSLVRVSIFSGSLAFYSAGARVGVEIR